jgi:hypothetical protein
MKYYYTYLTASEHGYFYVGRHTTSDIHDGYQGSGNWVRLCNKMKVPLHTKILSFYTDEIELKKAEQKLLNDFYYFDKNMNLSLVSSGFPSGENNPSKRKEVIAKRPQNNKGARTSWFCDPTRINPGSLDSNKKRNSEFMKNLWKDPEYRKLKTDNHHTKKLQYKENLSINNPMYNDAVREKVRQKVLQSVADGTHNSKILVECPICKKVSSKPNASRWHFDRCKFLRQP